ncbi:MAG: hypothetical protein UZ15_CFX003002900 [Chloroflexi bacterium OLB15]|nr:MAG: hypothetical protein UZ15_CFX003002900 [Chloroflexi bacterium OLB15]
MVTSAGRVFRTYKDGSARINGFLEDYACLAEAFLQLYQTTFDPHWYVLAQTLADNALKHFRAPDGGFFDTPDDGETLIARPRSLQDNAVPAGSSIMAKVLVMLAAYSGSADYEQAARETLAPLDAAMRQVPQAFGEALAAASMLVRGVREIAVVGEFNDDRTVALLTEIFDDYRPNAVVALSPADVDGEHTIPLLSYRTMQEGEPTVYVCRQFACQLPVTTPDALQSLLD